ncbi:NAD(P)/FAD-dependent oxidoreductase [Autumnicola musiva]|uniref:NAD(P)/FAD-dependent oxidoreductase n=1 Tax=Autumnicola musiva TaxID=3075589 RepID=A0ABU3DB13_9FLAO|nr:NAD(P)/FAD-dependent oxidoreductase [Zunongwangia sp. F117]MDT0678712.1 NAD(P)/FAD-dependent oxidoreductase [Zunongwangia sp. F117]
MSTSNYFEVIIVGGSYAGLSAALALGRSLRNVLIIDNGLPCNRQTPYSHNFITQDGREPGDVIAEAKAQVLKYSSVKMVNATAVKGEKLENGFQITTPEGEDYKCRKLIFATGVKDIIPNINGFSECWGISVIHCPYCHGYEFKGQKTGIMANGENAVHLASLVINLTKSLSILTTGKANFNESQIQKLEKHKIKIIETEIQEIDHESGHLKNVIFSDGRQLPLDALYAAIPFMQHSAIPASLGCEFTKGGHITTNSFHKTTTEGIFACGDCATMMRSVANAVSSGNFTGAIVNKELADEAF